MDDAIDRAERCTAGHGGALCDRCFSNVVNASPSPARDEVREAAEKLWHSLTPPRSTTDDGMLLVRAEDVEAVLRALASSRHAPAHAPLPPAVREAYRGVLLYPYGSPLHKAEWRKLCAALDGKPEGGA